ncbi:Sec-independent protein translocase protein TatB [Bordetella genomosp. 5]|uniref:Sec-independent protein translocase protein TatB n=1 Tax=Bordetella genomosp. 5 TaxID=1395608 RepID=A0A261TZU5_9BORD|nr:Sec-independent protein translocase protein TatB [Bordetella genomosp. 5]OZI55149.1 twin-arginine translocase subunit TatB [Bordetella genomosp. 5]
MFDVSFTELLVVGVVALIVIGPERLPKVARTVGHLLGRAQRYVNDVKSDIQREIELDELRKFKRDMDDAASEVHTSVRQASDSLRTSGDALRAELDDTARAVAQSGASPAAESPAAGSPAAGSPAAGSPAAPDPTIAPPSAGNSVPSPVPSAPAAQVVPAPAAPAPAPVSPTTEHSPEPAPKNPSTGTPT